MFLRANSWLCLWYLCKYLDQINNIKGSYCYKKFDIKVRKEGQSIPKKIRKHLILLLKVDALIW